MWFIILMMCCMQTFWVQQFLHAKHSMCSIKCQLQVLLWLSHIHLAVVKYARLVAVEDGTERSAISPAGGEVGHLNFVAVKEARKTHHTVH